MQFAMMHSFARAAASVLCLALAMPAHAQWTGKGEAGVALASGNTDTKTANARVAVGLKADAWDHAASLAGLYVRNAGATSARRWELAAQTQYSSSANTYWFGGLRYEEDRFSGFDHQGAVTMGVGRKFIENDTTKLSAQTGVGYKFLSTTGTVPLPADKDTDIVGVASLNFEHKLTASTSVFNRFSAETTSSNSFVQNDMGIAVKMTDRMALSVGYGLRHNTDPPAGFRKTDSLSTVNLVYEVK